MNTPLIQEFFSYLNHEKHFSPHTLKCYSTDLRQFVEFLDGTSSPDTAVENSYQDSGRAGTALALEVRAEILAVTAATVREFLVFLHNKNYTRSTTARKLAGTSSLSQGTDSPATTVERVKLK